MAELAGDDDDGDDEMIVPLGYRDAHTPQLEVASGRYCPNISF
jgi:hypothetical protein